MKQTQQFIDFRLQGVQRLSSALQSQNYSTVMANFELDPMAGQAHMERGDAVGAFLACLQADVDSRNVDNGDAADAAADSNDQTNNNE